MTDEQYNPGAYEQSNPDVYEQLYLSNIESQNIMSISDIENFRISQHTDISQDLLSMIKRLKEYNAYFLSCKPIAQRLSNIGKLQLSKRLNEILSDTEEAIKIFKRAYENTLDKNETNRK